MRLLLDTHAFIWAVHRPQELSSAAADAIAASDNDVYFSTVVSWEIAIKRALGRMHFVEIDDDVLSMFGLRRLPVDLEHCGPLVSLEQHHRDPFDRMLIAQAMVEGLTIVTRDRVFSDYDVPVLW